MAYMDWQEQYNYESYRGASPDAESQNEGSIPASDHHAGTPSQESKITYVLKILNPKRKKEFTVRKFRCEGKFGSPRELRLKLLDEFQDSLPDRVSFNIGYYRPGRGSAKMYLVENDDLNEMYRLFGASLEVHLWCDGVASDAEEPEQPGASAGRKRKNETDPPPLTACTSKRAAIRQEVQEIVEKLEEKHRGKYTDEQIRIWANMIQIGTHASYDRPPPVPMFGSSKEKKSKDSDKVVDILSGIAEGVAKAFRPPTQPHVSQSSSPPRLAAAESPTGVSPGKVVALRSQYIQQLTQLHTLLEAKALTPTEYEEQKGHILSKLIQP